jgi:hypothetical protein
MELPEGSEKIVAAFKDLPDSRKGEIVAHLAATPEDRANATVTQLIENGGLEAKLVTAIFGKQAPTKGSSPQNKAVGAPETK